MLAILRRRRKAPRRRRPLTGYPQKKLRPTTPEESGRSRFSEELYRSYWADLCRWLKRRYGRTTGEVEEIAQDAFEKIVSLDSHAHIRDPRAFLFTTAVNLALTRISWLSRTRRLIEGELRAAGEEIEEITPERVHASAERFKVVERTLEQLPAKQRHILIRSRFDGHTYEQIEAETGWSKAEISRQLQAGLQALQRALEDFDNGRGKE